MEIMGLGKFRKKELLLAKANYTKIKTIMRKNRCKIRTK